LSSKSPPFGACFKNTSCIINASRISLNKGVATVLSASCYVPAFLFKY
jgi:hypothetical protein